MKAIRSVLVTRPQPSADGLAEKLRREGFKAYVAPMMSYVVLPAAVPALEAYQGLVFTSRQAVSIFTERSKERILPVFCVGDATADAARKSGFQRVYAAEGGGQSLIELIRAHKEELRLMRLLHVCGEDVAEDIVRPLQAAHITVDPLIVYKAEFIHNIPYDVERALLLGDIDTVMLFSARAASQLCLILQRGEFANVSRRLEAVCISPRVAEAANGVTWGTVRVAVAPALEEMMKVLKEDKKMTTDEQAASRPQAENRSSERRGGPDRRQRRVQAGPDGLIRTEGYVGPDRRTGIDRRSHEARQRQKVWEVKKAFLNRTSLSAAFLTVAIIYAAYFLLAPEIQKMDENSARMHQMEERMAQLNAQLLALQQEKQKASLGGIINSQIEKAENAGADVADAVKEAASGQGPIVTTSLETLMGVLSQVQALNRTAEGRAALDAAMIRLQTVLQNAKADPADLNDAINVTQKQDPTLAALLEGINKENMGAAVLLLALNELRTNLDRQNPFQDDLALIQKMAGGDPTLKQALDRLAPYAESGVLSRQALQQQLGLLAGDIVAAKLSGQDASVKDAALRRLQNLVKIRRIDDVTGNSVDAVVARAQLTMDKGDMTGAIKELQALEGPPADVARPWVEQAVGAVVAEDASNALSQIIFQILSSSAQAQDKGGFSLPGALETLRSHFLTSPSILDLLHPQGAAPFPVAPPQP